ncbi:MAG: sodium:glutamate symporter [Lachnospiraceae bacterium]|nr:sodium:glutamate symporter [Lachnospiraceae bacterium]
MTLASLYQDMMVMSLLLMGGFVIRAFCKPLQRLFLPASVVAGVIGLVLGQQVLGIITIPESFPSFNGIMMRVIMTCVVLGISVTAKQMKEHMDYALANIFLYGTQMLIGIAIMLLMSPMSPGIPEGWGILGTFAYFGSHGSAGAAAAILEEGGAAGATSIGMVLATGGLIWSMVVGMWVVNYGVKKGWATFVKNPEKQPDYFYRGLLPEDKKESIGSTTTSPVAINPLALQLGLIMLCYALGYGIFTVVVKFVPIFSKINAMLYGMLGGLILWPVMKKTHTDGYVDRKTLNQINGFCLEILITTSIASLSLDVIVKYWLPLLVHVLVCCTFTTVFLLWYFKKIGNPQWFEKCLMVLGCCTGASANGLALVRAVDPNSESCAPTAHGVYNAIFWWNNLLTPIIPAMILVNLWSVIGVAGLLAGGAVILMLILFGRKKA